MLIENKLIRERAKGYAMTNLEKLKSGTDNEIQILLTQLAYRSSNYNYQDIQVVEWMNDEVRVNKFGDVIL